MGLFEKIFGKGTDIGRAGGYFKLLTGYTPAWTSWDGKLYESARVRAAIDARALHISKLRVQITGSARPKLHTKLAKQPNPWQTWSQFLYRTSTILDMQNTVFIVPLMDPAGETEGVFPVLPTACELVEYQGEAWLRIKFAQTKCASIELSKVGVMTKFQYANDLTGETNAALTPTMELINVQNQGIRESVKNGATYRFWARLGNYANAADLKAERKNFSAQNFDPADGGGMLLFPTQYTDIHQVESKPWVVDADQMAQINANVSDYYHTSDKIIKGEATGDELNGFYEVCGEPFAIQFSEVMTRMLFTLGEQARGAGVHAAGNRLQYMSFQDRLKFAESQQDRGAMLIDEIREMAFDLPPLPNGQGQVRSARGEYYFLDVSGNLIKKEGSENGEKQDTNRPAPAGTDPDGAAAD